MRKIILASTSPARRRLLKRLGYPFSVEKPGIDEKPFQDIYKNPRILVERLAEEKARSVAFCRPGAIVIGSDQMMVCGKKVFGQPGSAARARAQLKFCAGKTIEVLTAVCVIDTTGDGVGFTHRTRMKFRRLSDREIREYVEADQPLACAGSFKFESRGASLFESVATDDPTSIEGLPILHLHRILRPMLLLK